MPAALKKRPALASPAPRSRRERRARAEPAIVRHVVMPGLEVGSASARPRETVSAFLRRSGWAARDRRYGWQFKKGLPTILEINGEAVLRKQWTRRRIGANDNVRFVSYPLGGAGGGGAKQVIGLVALVAVSAFAIWAGPLVAGALGFGGSTLVGGLATADRPWRLAAGQCPGQSAGRGHQRAELDAGPDLFRHGAGQHGPARPAAAGLVWAAEDLRRLRGQSLGRVCRQRSMAQRAAIRLDGQHVL
jgi:hypothetical protein